MQVNLINKQEVGVFGKYRIFSINPEELRDSSVRKEEFTDYGFNAWYKFIPKNEIWVSNRLNSNDLHFALVNAFTQIKYLNKGLSFHKAYLKGLEAEQAEREKVDHEHFRGQKHIAIPEDLYVQDYITLSDSIKVKIVNGELVRDLFKTDFVEGSNSEIGGHYIPKGEIWIEKDVSDSERPYIVIHEYTEMTLMKYSHLPYNKAHTIASKIEYHFRSIGMTKKDLVQLSRYWVYNNLRKL